jgi:hypothetical protein
VICPEALEDKGEWNHCTRYTQFCEREIVVLDKDQILVKLAEEFKG